MGEAAARSEHSRRRRWLAGYTWLAVISGCASDAGSRLLLAPRCARPDAWRGKWRPRRRRLDLWTPGIAVARPVSRASAASG